MPGMLQKHNTAWNRYACDGSADQVHGPAIDHDDICRLSLSQLSDTDPGTGTETSLQHRGLKVSGLKDSGLEV